MSYEMSGLDSHDTFERACEQRGGRLPEGTIINLEAYKKAQDEKSLKSKKENDGRK